MDRKWDRVVFVVGGIFLAGLGTSCDRGPKDATSPTPATGTAEKTGEGAMIVEVPLGLPPLPVPADNPMTQAKVELGRLLYFDPRLSKSGSISCASCHIPEQAWTEHHATSAGIGGLMGTRNSPTVINAAYLPVLFWDGRAPSLEAQALGPIENPLEMGHKMDVLVADIANVPEYKERFQNVFGTAVNQDGIGKAIAAFERTILSGNSAYDRYQKGEKNALTEQQQRGMALFMGKASCNQCHTPPIFSNGGFYNAGIGSNKETPDPGRMKVTGDESDRGSFRVPSLRNASHTWPYFHDGSAGQLADAVRVMAGGGIENPNLSPTFRGLKAVKLTDEDLQALTAFVDSLAGPYPVVQAPQLP